MTVVIAPIFLVYAPIIGSQKLGSVDRYPYVLKR